MLQLSDPHADPYEYPELPSIKGPEGVRMRVLPTEFSLDGWGILLAEEVDGSAMRNAVWIALDQISDLVAALKNAAERARSCAAYYGHDIATAKPVSE